MAAKRKSSGQQSNESPDASELMVLELQQIHSAENQLSRVLPRLAKAADAESLRGMLQERVSEGERIIAEVEAALDSLEQSPGRKKNIAAEGLINDAREHAQELQAGPALDTVLIGAIQKTEHYCIAAWGTAKALAKATGQKNAAQAMERAIKQGATFDERLTQLAEQEITPALLAQDEGSDDAESTSGSAKSSRKNGQNERRT